MLSCTDSCSVAWITIRIGWRGPKFGDGTHCAIGLRGGAWVQAASAKASRARTARRWMGMRALQRAGGGMQIVGAGRAGLGRVLLLPLRRQGKVGRGCPRFALILKTPLPNPSRSEE